MSYKNVSPVIFDPVLKVGVLPPQKRGNWDEESDQPYEEYHKVDVGYVSVHSPIYTAYRPESISNYSSVFINLQSIKPF